MPSAVATLATLLGRVLRAIFLDAHPDEVAGMIGGHVTALYHVSRYLVGRPALVKFVTNHMTGLDRVVGRYVVGDALGLQGCQEFIVVGVSLSGRDRSQRA